MHLPEEFEAGAVGGGAEALDLRQAAGLLTPEVIAGEAEHGQALVAEAVLQLLQTGVLAGEAAAAGHVHDQQHASGVVAERFLAAIRAEDGHVADADRHRLKALLAATLPNGTAHTLGALAGRP